MSRLLIAGSNSIHTFNYLKLIEGFFDEVLLITTSPAPEYKGNYHWFNFSLRNPLSAYRTVRSLKKIINDYSPDVIHLQQANSVAYLTLLAAGKSKAPRILTGWGSDILTTPDSGFLYKKMVVWILKHAGYFTADANFVGKRMKELAPHIKKVSIINLGIDVNFPSMPKENIIYSNRLHKKLYRLDKIIDAFKKLTEQAAYNQWKLVVAAEGEETSALKSLVATSGVENRVDFVGWLGKEKNMEMYARAKVFVSVPESDATSISLLEAMAAGCVPVVSNLPANNEWITSGENGFIVKDLDSDFLEPALTSDMQKIASINKSIIQQRGTKEIAREQFLNIYRNILKERA